MKNILVIGSSNTDMIIRVPRIPRPGETILGGTFSMSPGGKGANQAVAAARAGGRVTFVARAGDDIFGRQALRNFEADGIDTRFVACDAWAPSGVALINVADDGENAISVAPGANARLTSEDIQKAAAAFEGSDIVLMQLETPLDTVRAAVEAARIRGIPVILNPAPARELDDGLLKNVTILTPNETEAEALTGIKVATESDARRAAAALRARGPRGVIITLGEKGCYAAADDFEGRIPAFRVRPVDTTAAGDVFNGALAVALAEQRAIVEALRFASAAAALSVTKLGAQPSAPTRADIEKLLDGRNI
ncbi:MAG: ribokinase [Candidatus Aminicenantales bacterium]